jgi:hypothetical protein
MGLTMADGMVATRRRVWAEVLRFHILETASLDGTGVCVVFASLAQGLHDETRGPRHLRV